MQITWTIKARQNLLAVKNYIAQDNPVAAIKTIRRIIKAVEVLVHQPELGRLGRIYGTRELVVTGTSYIIPYRIKDECIEILRVLHGAMKWPVQIEFIQPQEVVEIV